MSTFAVFGMTRAMALEIARKQTSTRHKGNDLSETEWLALVEQVADEIMAGERVRQLSPMFDAPQYAAEFIDIAKRTERCRDLQVKAKQPLKDAQGKPVYTKNGKTPRKGWTVYGVGSAA